MLLSLQEQRMQFRQLKRREFMSLFAAVAAWPFTARAQQGDRVRRIAVLMPLPPPAFAPFFSALGQNGFVEGASLAVDRRGFDGRYDQFPDLVAEIVKAAPDAILCAGDEAIRAAQAATSRIPIVAITDDMVGAGLARSLARPGGNTTGVSILAGDLDGKRQDVLLEFFPNVRHVVALSDVHNNTPAQLQALHDAARARAVTLSIERVNRSEEIAGAIENAKDAGAQALNVLASPLLYGNRRVIFERAAALRLPAIYQWPDMAQEGGLLAYGPRFAEAFRALARQMAQILRGANPADLPIEQPTKFELAVNLRTAKAVGRTSHRRCWCAPTR
jgi:putative ABC transport system substrate-binding protein